MQVQKWLPKEWIYMCLTTCCSSSPPTKQHLLCVFSILWRGRALRLILASEGSGPLALPFAKQTQHLHKRRQIVVPVVAKVSRMLQQGRKRRR